MQNENYATARALATIEHLGETFKIVRRRHDGKPWRGYLALVHGDTMVAQSLDAADPKEAAVLYGEKLKKTFATREALLESLVPLLEKFAPPKAEETP